MRISRRFFVVAGLALFVSFAHAASDWEKTLSAPIRGSFPNPRPQKGTYQFGWNQVIAATAEISFAKTGDRLELTGTGQTVGVVRALWHFDVEHRALADATTLRPISMHQIDQEHSKTVTTDLVFSDTGVIRTRTDSKAKHPPTPKNFNFRGLYDLHSALLYVRSQPLRDGDVQRLVVYPETTPYLATVTVAAHENVTVGAGTYRAIKLNLQLSKIGKTGVLEPHTKFRQASAWFSDDADRLLLRVEARVFIGTVFADLQAIKFP